MLSFLKKKKKFECCEFKFFKFCNFLVVPCKISQSSKLLGGVFVSVTSESSRAGITCALWSACPGHWQFFCYRKTGGEPDGCVNPRRRTCWSLSLQAPAPPHSRQRERLPVCRRLPDPVTWRHSQVRLSVLFPELLHVAAGREHHTCARSTTKDSIKRRLTW